MANLDEDLKKKILSGDLYDSMDERITSYQEEKKALVNEYNATSNDEKGFQRRQQLLLSIFGENGKDAYIEPPFHANFGGAFVKLGKNFYSNFNLTLVDDGEITIGDSVLFGPNVTIVTAGHPLHPQVRGDGIQFNEPVHIGNCCWLGANVVVLPGVSIGDNCVIGAGSLVTKDIPANSLALGSPARVIKEIGEEDLKTYRRGKPVPKEFLPKD